MRNLLLGIVLAVFWIWITFVVANDAEKEENTIVKFLGYLADIVVTILVFWIILDQYFGIKLSDLIR